MYELKSNALLSGRTGQCRSRPDRGAKIGRSIRVEVDLLHRRVAVAVTSSIAIRSGVVHVPDLFTIRAGEESTKPSVKKDEPNRY